MKYRIFHILYWLLSHYIPQLILAALIIGTCLTSCRTTQHHFTDVSKTIVHDTIRVTNTQVTDLSALSTMRYEQTILDLQTRIDSLTGTPRRDTIRITHTRWQKTDTVILHHHDTITIAAAHTDTLSIATSTTDTHKPHQPLWLDIAQAVIVTLVMAAFCLLIRRFL